MTILTRCINTELLQNLPQFFKLDIIMNFLQKKSLKCHNKHKRRKTHRIKTAWNCFTTILQVQRLGLLPSEDIPAEVAICTCFLVDGVFQFQSRRDVTGTQIKVLFHYGQQLSLAVFRCTVIEYGDGQRLSNTNSVRHLSVTTFSLTSFSLTWRHSYFYCNCHPHTFTDPFNY